MNTPILKDIPMDQFLGQIASLSRNIAGSGWVPDYVVGIGRGGLVPATWLSHAIGRPMVSVDMSAKLPDFCDSLLLKLVGYANAGSKLLIVDDINDSGRTISRIRASFSEVHKEHLRIAVLINNIRSMTYVDFCAEEIDRSITKDWFVFPWEAVASYTNILKDWGEVPQRTA